MPQVSAVLLVGPSSRAPGWTEVRLTDGTRRFLPPCGVREALATLAAEGVHPTPALAEALEA